jgi:hypothetical protein
MEKAALTIIVVAYLLFILAGGMEDDVGNENCEYVFEEGDGHDKFDKVVPLLEHV